MRNVSTPAIAACALVTSLLGGACASTHAIRSVSAPHAHEASTATAPRASAREVPEGARFAARLDDDIDTIGTQVGDRFTASLESPLRDSAGRIVVPAGARVHGHVVAVGKRYSPRLRVAFDAIDTVNGPVDLSASLRGADWVPYPGPSYLRSSPGFSSAAYPAASPIGAFAGPGAVRGTELAREVHVSAGARLDLQLTRPLLVP